MEDIFSVGILFSTIRLATPLLLAAMGGLFSERSGVINIALEGLLLAGAFTAATVTHFSGNPWVGLLAAIAAGVAVAAIHAVACIRFKADQVVSGTAINILFIGVPALLSGALFDSTGATPQIPKNQLLPLAPIVIAFAVVPLTWYVLNRTRFTAVGYGTVRETNRTGFEGILDNVDRNRTEQGFNSLTKAWLNLPMNVANGNGGTCYGDSGGPHFIHLNGVETDIVASVTVTGDAPCKALDKTYRMDTEAARSFLSNFVDLP